LKIITKNKNIYMERNHFGGGGRRKGKTDTEKEKRRRHAEPKD